MATRHRFAEIYTKIRIGKAFLIGICVFCSFWIGYYYSQKYLITWIPSIDGPDFGRLTLILSVEASIASSMILAAADTTESETRKRDEREAQLLRYVADLMESQIAISKTLESHILEKNYSPASDKSLDENHEEN